jgi:hypothetical protein
MVRWPRPRPHHRPCPSLHPLHDHPCSPAPDQRVALGCGALDCLEPHHQLQPQTCLYAQTGGQRVRPVPTLARRQSRTNGCGPSAGLPHLETRAPCLWQDPAAAAVAAVAVSLQLSSCGPLRHQLHPEREQGLVLWRGLGRCQPDRVAREAAPAPDGAHSRTGGLAPGALAPPAHLPSHPPAAPREDGVGRMEVGGGEDNEGWVWYSQVRQLRHSAESYINPRNQPPMLCMRARDYPCKQ